MKRLILPMTALVLLVSGCAQINVPPADYDEPAATAAETETETEAETETETKQETTRPKETKETKETSDTDEDTEDKETETEPIEIAPWAERYAALLKQKDNVSEHLDAYYALVKLDSDKIPELFLLDDVYMSIYYYDAENDKAELLLEDAYKGSAADDSNVCIQPETGKVASAFSTMGGGSGYNFFFYEAMDPLRAERYNFNNNEDKDGEMPYNDIWDRAEEFDIQNNGYHDVTLGDTWTVIGKEFEDIRKLKPADAETLTIDWLHILDDIHETEEQEETEETTKKKNSD